MTQASNDDVAELARCRVDLERVKSELAERDAALAVRAAENSELVDRLRLALEELSTPVLEVWDDVLALPIVGVVDTQRSVKMVERVLSELVARRSKFVIVDLTGVDIVDTSTADRLVKLARAVELLGAKCVVSGIQPVVAQTLMEIGVELSELRTARNLKRALDECISSLREAES
ncbi:MAG TPA: STAS domain-containing protein [Polyangiaceae bacterium]|nr:STAS domain-containing protein [Polyangiaceae bacterium]